MKQSTGFVLQKVIFQPGQRTLLSQWSLYQT